MPINVVIAEHSGHLPGKYRTSNNVKIHASLILIPDGPGDLIAHCSRVHGMLEAFGVMPVSGQLTFAIENGEVKSKGTLTKYSERIGSQPDHLIFKVEKVLADIARDYGQLFEFVMWEMTQSCNVPSQTPPQTSAEGES